MAFGVVLSVAALEVALRLATASGGASLDAIVGRLLGSHAIDLQAHRAL